MMLLTWLWTQPDVIQYKFAFYIYNASAMNVQLRCGLNSVYFLTSLGYL